MEEERPRIRSAKMSRSAAILILLIGFLTFLVNFVAAVAIVALGATLLIILHKLTNVK